MAAPLTPQDITTDTYLRQHSKRFGLGVGPVNYLGVVSDMSHEAGRWFFQVRYLHRPGSKATMYWSEHLYEEDLCHFEAVTLQEVKEWLSGGWTKREPRLPAWMREKESMQLRLFDGSEGEYVSSHSPLSDDEQA